MHEDYAIFGLFLPAVEEQCMQGLALPILDRQHALRQMDMLDESVPCMGREVRNASSE
jgi:hypothetical protein